MSYLSTYVTSIERAGYEIFWLGATSALEVERLEKLLGVRLPGDFKQFLIAYGGGGVVNAEISGIEDNDATSAFGGTVWGDTSVCRQRFGMPDHLVVIYFHDDEVCWCIDSTPDSTGNCRVVSFDVFGKKVDRILAPSFGRFIEQHFWLYASSS